MVVPESKERWPLDFGKKKRGRKQMRKREMQRKRKRELGTRERERERRLGLETWLVPGTIMRTNIHAIIRIK